MKSNLINTGKIEVSNNILVKKDLENRGSIVTNKNLNIDKDLINSGNIQAVGETVEHLQTKLDEV